MKNLGKKRVLLVGHSIVFLRVITCYETKKGVYFHDYNRERVYLQPKGSVALPEWSTYNGYDQDFEYDLSNYNENERIAA